MNNERRLKHREWTEQDRKTTKSTGSVPLALSTTHALSGHKPGQGVSSACCHDNRRKTGGDKVGGRL